MKVLKSRSVKIRSGFLATLSFAALAPAALASSGSTKNSASANAVPAAENSPAASAASSTYSSASSSAAVATGKIKYKAGKDVNFEELLIQGQLKRPELSVVTGNTQPGSDGLLRLRENFTDRITTDVGEELP